MRNFSSLILIFTLFSCSKTDDSPEISNITFLERFHYTTWKNQSTDIDGTVRVIFKSFSNEEDPNHITFYRLEHEDNFCNGAGVKWSVDSNGEYTIPSNTIEILINTNDKLQYARHINSDQIRLYEFTEVSGFLNQRTKLIKDDLYGNTSDWGLDTVFQKVEISYIENFMLCTYIRPASFRRKFD